MGDESLRLKLMHAVLSLHVKRRRFQTWKILLKLNGFYPRRYITIWYISRRLLFPFFQFSSCSIYFAASTGFLRTMMTESPRRNIFEMYLSRFTGCCFPLAPFGRSTHISLTFSRTMLQ